MFSRMKNALIALSVCIAWASPNDLFAANGNILHGIGAANTARGGAGVAASSDPIGALHLNPALLLDIEGERIDAGFAVLKSNLKVDSGIAAFSGSSDHEGGLDVVPAIGWKRQHGNIAIGFGVLGTAGFGSDFAAGGSNPIFAPQPFGFGSVQSSYKMMKMPAAVAFRATDRLSFGFAAVGAMAQLSASPAGFVPPDCSAGGCYYPALDDSTAFGLGAQAGLTYRLNGLVSFGASYSTPVRFRPFHWNTKSLNPAVSASRRVEFRIDAPQWYSLGAAIHVTPRTVVVGDAKWMQYSSARGLGDSGINPSTGAVRGLGWRDIFVFAAGFDHAVTDRFTVRAGYNRGDTPVVASAAFFNVATAGVFEKHYGFGAGYQFSPAFALNCTYYHAPAHSVTGSIPTPQGPVPASFVRLTNGIDSFVVTVAYSRLRR